MRLGSRPPFQAVEQLDLWGCSIQPWARQPAPANQLLPVQQRVQKAPLLQQDVQPHGPRRLAGCHHLPG